MDFNTKKESVHEETSAHSEGALFFYKIVLDVSRLKYKLTKFPKFVILSLSRDKTPVEKERKGNKMRFTKAIREYVNEELTNKRLEANKNDYISVEYQNARNQAIDEIKPIVEHARAEVKKILDEYGLENMKSGYFNIIELYDNYIGNLETASTIRAREKERYDKQKKAIRDIEIECTLGADREQFMELLNSITF